MTLSRRAIVVDRWDLERYDGLDFPTFAAEGEALLRLAPETGRELWADLFAALDLATPTLVDVDAMESGFELNHQVMAHMLVQREFELLRTWTQGNAFAAASAVMGLRPTIETVFDRFRTTQRVAEALADKRKRLEEMDDEEPELASKLEELAGEEQALAAQEDRDAGEAMLALRSSMRQVAEATEAEVDRARMLASDEDLTRMPAEKRLELAKTLNTERFAAMADMFGAVANLMAAAQRLHVPEVPAEPGDITYGRDLARVLPSSLMQLDDPDRELLFLADYADGRLPMLEQRGTAPVGRGGIVACSDTSISMATPMHPSGTRDLRAKALGLVLLHQCREQDRAFYGILFSDRYQVGPNKGQVQLAEFDFTGPFDADTVIAFTETFFAGGTNFTHPLDRALALLEAEFEATGRTESDIVFITDGEAVVSDAWLRRFHTRLHRIGGRVWGLLMGGAEFEPLTTICEGRVATFDQISDPEADLVAVMGGLTRKASA